MEEKHHTFDILQPELSSKDDLINEICKRNVKVEGLKTLNKEALIEIFYKNVVPLPQRKYRQNRRGKEMTQNQTQEERRKRKHEHVSDSINLNTGINNGYSISGSSNSIVRFSSSYNPKTTGTRLKPPPSAINFERKVIKLGKSSASSSISIDGSDEKNSSNGSDSLTKKPGVISLKNPRIETVLKSESSRIGNVEIKTITKSVPKSPTQGDEKVTVKITKITPPNKSTNTRIKLKRPDRNSYTSTCTSPSDGGSTKMETDTSGPAQSPPTKTDSGSQMESPTEEGNVRKKFKRIDIKFP